MLIHFVLLLSSPLSDTTPRDRLIYNNYSNFIELVNYTFYVLLVSGNEVQTLNNANNRKYEKKTVGGGENLCETCIYLSKLSPRVESDDQMNFFCFLKDNKE